MPNLRFLDLFSGIGGFSLGLERAGHRTVAFCEIDPYCRKVLAKHWPQIHCYDDVGTLTARSLAADGIDVDAICGGFPCQDISLAGRGDGIMGKRSGLWVEYARIVGELRPRYVVVENVAALLNRGLDRVLGDLAALGYDAEWHCVPASAVGAPHRRDRIWIVAYPNGARCTEQGGECQQSWGAKAVRPSENMAYSNEQRSQGWDSNELSERTNQQPSGKGSPYLADTAGQPDSGNGNNGNSNQYIQPARQLGGNRIFPGGWPVHWCAEPDVGRVADGVPARVDRLKCLGNAVVPQIPEMIGRALVALN